MSDDTRRLVQKKLDKKFEEDFQRNVKLYELDSSLTKDDRKILEQFYGKVNNYSFFASVLLTAAALSTVPTHERLVQIFKNKPPTRFGSFVMRLGVGIVCTVSPKPFINQASKIYHLADFTKTANKKCVDIVNLDQEDDYVKVHRYYKDTIEHPENAKPDPRTFTQEQIDLIKRTYYRYHYF